MPSSPTIARTESSPARKKGRERKQKILDAARKRLIEYGMEGVVLREISEDLGITHGNLQYYFQTKDDLIRAIFDEETLKYTESIKEAIRNTSSRQGRLSAIIDSSFALLGSDETKLWRRLFGIADTNKELSLMLQRENELYEETLCEELKLIAPDLTAARRCHIAKIIRMIIDGFGISLIYEDVSSASTAALKSEIKAVLQKLLEIS